MKHFSLILLLAWMGMGIVMPSHAQQQQFVIYMADTSLIHATRSGSAVTLTSPNQAIQAILSRYTCYDFRKYAAASRFEYMQHYYSITCNDIQLMADLRNFDDELFPMGQREEYTPTYEPNEFSMSPSVGSEEFLRFIHAPEAWDITHGSPDIVVGVTDTYFDTDHTELSGKFARVRENNPPDYDPIGGFYDPIAWEHGTSVLGFLAAKTDNNYGVAGIGWNSRFDVSNGFHTADMLQMSKDGRRILNGSWFHTGSYDCDMYQGKPLEQAVYDEIYENGTIPFFGAANGPGQTPGCGNPLISDLPDLDAFVYPASLDHCMSITSVGHANELSEPTGVNMKGVHRSIQSDPLASFHHNSRVDLVAPGYLLPYLTHNPVNGNELAWNGWGTSYSSPMCAGTAALMLAVKDCLSPYQLEYLLKKTADASIYDISFNSTYAGKLGAGLLDAGKAVQWANTFSCNDPATTTFNIKGIEINTVCVPGHASNGAKPKFTPILENGTPPYTYKWESMYGNTTTLDATNIAEPTVMTSTLTDVYPTHLAYYRLTVYDNSQVQKVANKIIKVELKTEANYDLAMRDLYMDMLDEPNTMSNVDPRTNNVWKSPDIWNRLIDDDGTTNQLPLHHPDDTKNYLYLRVRNVGCAANPFGIKVYPYWTMASTSEEWNKDWDGTGGYYPGTTQPRGGLMSSGLFIPPMQPGESTVLKQPWQPVDPHDYDPSITRLETCLLARIVDPAYPFFMSIKEVTNTNVGINVINNNNIATHNTFTTLLNPHGVAASQHLVLVGNASLTPMTSSIQLVNEKHINPHFAGDLSAVVQTKLYLDQTLYARWQAGNFAGNYASKDDINKTVTFDGDNMELKNITLNPGERFKVKIEFKLITNAVVPDARFEVHFRQWQQQQQGNGQTLYGNTTYEINTTPGSSAMMAKMSPEEGDSPYHIYPNPAKGQVTVEYHGKDQEVRIAFWDILGRKMLETATAVVGYQPYNMDISSLVPGVYMITITDKSGKAKEFKVVKE